MTNDQLIRKALQELVDAATSAYSDDSDLLRSTGYAQAILDLTEEKN